MHKASATLLTIDDDEMVRESLAACSEDGNLKVLQTLNGLQDLQISESEQPGLVIRSLHIPQIDSLELIRRTRQTALETSIVVLSGAGVMSDVVEALRLGTADYLIKSLEDLAVLEHSVYRALDRAYPRVESQRYRDKLEVASRELQASLNLFQEDQDADRQMQVNMLSMTPWSIEGLEFSHRIIPSLCLFGGSVDYFRANERRVAFYLADVSDHSVSSASVMVLLKFMIMRLPYKSRRDGTLPKFKPSKVLTHINRGLINTKLDKYVTVLGGVIGLEKDSLAYSIGGHLSLPVLFVDGRASYLEGRDLPVGLLDDTGYDDRVTELLPSSSLSLFSDGISDVLPGVTLKEKEVSLPEQVAVAGSTLNGSHQAFRLANLAEMPGDIALPVLSRNLV